MSKSKQRLLEINAMLADNVSAKGVDASKDETTTSLVHKVEQIKTSKPEQEKTVIITENGTTEVLPDENKVLSKVKVEVDVPTVVGDNTNKQVSALIGRSVKKFTIPEGCSNIGHYAFYACTELTSLHIPNTVTKISQNAFSMCYKLKTELPDSVTYIGTSAFDSNGHQIITKLPSELKTIGNTAFQYCSAPFTLSEIPAKVETIGKLAFHNCTGFTELTFKGKPISIYSNSFQGCTNLLNIYVPWSEGEVANAPWGATNATIHYNSEVSNAES